MTALQSRARGKLAYRHRGTTRCSRLAPDRDRFGCSRFGLRRRARTARGPSASWEASDIHGDATREPIEGATRERPQVADLRLKRDQRATQADADAQPGAHRKARLIGVAIGVWIVEGQAKVRQASVDDDDGEVGHTHADEDR